MRAKKFFNVIAILPIISPPFSVSLSIILLFGNKGLITHTLLGMASNNIYGFGGLPVCTGLFLLPDGLPAAQRRTEYDRPVH